MPRQTTWTRLDDTLERLLPRIVWVELSICSDSCWGCEIKFVTHPGSVSAGVTFSAGGGQTAEEVLRECLDAFDEMVKSERVVHEAMTEALAETVEEEE
jgi:hypothetical protein